MPPYRPLQCSCPQRHGHSGMILGGSVLHQSPSSLSDIFYLFQFHKNNHFFHFQFFDTLLVITSWILNTLRTFVHLDAVLNVIVLQCFTIHFGPLVDQFGNSGVAHDDVLDVMFMVSLTPLGDGVHCITQSVTPLNLLLCHGGHDASSFHNLSMDDDRLRHTTTVALDQVLHFTTEIRLAKLER